VLFISYDHLAIQLGYFHASISDIGQNSNWIMDAIQ